MSILGDKQAGEGEVGGPGRIVPLHTQAELVAEGREQKNSVASYTAGAVAGSCYIYRVLHPSRATLCIGR